MRLRGAAAVCVVALLAGCFGAAGPREPSAPALGEARFTRTAVFPGDYETAGEHSTVLEPGPFTPLPDEITDLDSRIEGGTIRIGVIRPDVEPGVRVPIIARASGFPGDLGSVPLAELSATTYGPSAAFGVENFVSHGYALAFIALRGWSGGSTGCGHWAHQAADIDQALQWLGEQDWSNGRIGMNGFSWGGGSQWMAAAFGNPYLKTIVPTSSFIDRYHEYYKNGTGASPDEFTLLPMQPPGPTSPCDNGRERAARLHSYQTGERDPGGYWDELNEKPRVLANYTGSVLVAHGLDRDLTPQVIYPWIQDLEAKGVVVKHLLGNWGHVMPDERGNYYLVEQDGPATSALGLSYQNPNPRADWAEILLHWYDAWLKDAAVDLGPRVEVQDTAGQWRQGTAWPPADAVPTAFHLEPGAALTTQGGDQRLSLPIGGDPTWGTATNLPETVACPGCQVFVTPGLASGLHFAGLPRLHVRAIPSSDTGHLLASLYELGPSGNAVHQHLGCARMNLGFAAGGETAVPFTAGQPLAVNMEFIPMDVAIAPGNRLALSIGQARTQSCLYDANLHGPQPSGPVTLEVGDGQSVLTLLDVHARSRRPVLPSADGPLIGAWRRLPRRNLAQLTPGRAPR